MGANEGALDGWNYADNDVYDFLNKKTLTYRDVVNSILRNVPGN